MKEYVAILEPAHDGSWSGYVPDLPGCTSSGETEAELRVNIREAIAFHLEGMQEDGEPIPEPTSKAALVPMPVLGATGVT